MSNCLLVVGRVTSDWFNKVEVEELCLGPVRRSSSFQVQRVEMKCDPCCSVQRSTDPPHVIRTFFRTLRTYSRRLCWITSGFGLLEILTFMCWWTKPLTEAFRSLIRSFNLDQVVQDPAHEKGLILDQVLTPGLNRGDL